MKRAATLRINPHLAYFREHPFPDVGRLCVMVPKKTEYWLRFSARLADGALGVRFELMARG
jgi:hypothetical protein